MTPAEKHSMHDRRFRSEAFNPDVLDVVQAAEQQRPERLRAFFRRRPVGKETRNEHVAEFSRLLSSLMRNARTLHPSYARIRPNTGTTKHRVAERTRRRFFRTQTIGHDRGEAISMAQFGPNQGQAILERARQRRADSFRVQLVQSRRGRQGGDTRFQLEPQDSSSLKAILLAAVVAIGLILYAEAMDSAFRMSISVYVLLAILLAATLSSVAGFAFSAICGALLVHLMDGPLQTVELMVVCSIAIQSMSVWAIRDAVEWKSLSTFLIGGVLSLPIGVYLLWHVKPRSFALLMGVFLISYGGIMLFRRPTSCVATSARLATCYRVWSVVSQVGSQASQGHS